MRQHRRVGGFARAARQDSGAKIRHRDCPPTAPDQRQACLTLAIILGRQRRPPPGNQSVADLPLKRGGERCVNL
jgi:hypothetical protein